MELKTYKPYVNRDGDMFIYHKGDEDLMLDDEDEIYLKSDADAAIAELKQANDKLVGAKKSAELILQNLLDCGLIKEWYFNGKFNAVLKADDPHLKIKELKQKLEDAKASAYAESVDSGMENRRLKRALWLAREWRAWCEGQFWFSLESDKPRDIYHLLLTNRIHRTPIEWIDYWYKVEQLCKKKAEEYK